MADYKPTLSIDQLLQINGSRGGPGRPPRFETYLLPEPGNADFEGVRIAPVDATKAGPFRANSNFGIQGRNAAAQGLANIRPVIGSSAFDPAVQQPFELVGDPYGPPPAAPQPPKMLESPQGWTDRTLRETQLGNPRELIARSRNPANLPPDPRGPMAPKVLDAFRAGLRDGVNLPERTYGPSQSNRTFGLVDNEGLGSIERPMRVPETQSIPIGERMTGDVRSYLSEPTRRTGPRLTDQQRLNVRSVTSADPQFKDVIRGFRPGNQLPDAASPELLRDYLLNHQVPEVRAEASQRFVPRVEPRVQMELRDQMRRLRTMPGPDPLALASADRYPFGRTNGSAEMVEASRNPLRAVAEPPVRPISQPITGTPQQMVDASRVPLTRNRGAGASPIPSAAPRGEVTFLDDPAAMVEASRTPVVADRGRMVEGFGELGPEMPVARDYGHLGMGGGGSGPTISDLHDEHVRGTIRPPRDRVAAGMGGPGASAADDVAAGMSRAGAAARAPMPPAGTGFMDDLGTLGGAVKDAASKVASPFARAGRAVMANPVAAAGVRTIGRAAPVVGMGLEMLADPNAHDSVEQLLGFDNLRASYDRGRAALAQGDYAGAGVEALKAIPKVAYAGTLKGGVALGDWLMGPPPAPLTAAQTKAKIAETAKGASLIDDDDTSDPIKNAARYEQIKAQREQRLQNEPTMNVRLRQAEGPMPDGSTPPQREVRLLADEVRNSPLRDEIMRAGVPTSGHITASEAVANGRAGGAGGAGGPTDFESQLRNAVNWFDKNQVPLSLRNQIVAALGHAHGDDSLAPYHEAAALNYIAQAQPKPMKEGEKAQADANSLRQSAIIARAALANPAATTEQKARAQAVLNEIAERIKFDRNIYHSGDPNDLDLGATIVEMRRQGAGLP